MICIIGASLAGDCAAAALRAEGYADRIVMIGDEPEAPYDRPPLSKAALFDDVDEARLFLRPLGWYEENDVELVLGDAVTQIDRAAHKLTLASGKQLEYDKLLIATGARARNLPDAEKAKVPVHLVRTLKDARDLRAALKPGQRIAIVGAGVIGLEVAASARKLGCEVDVVDLVDRVLARVVPPVISEFMAKVHTDHGVRLHMSAGSVSFTDKGLMTQAHGKIVADAIIVGIGVIPNMELAQQAGLECQNGIVVDDHARTSDPDIYAAGDVAFYPCPWVGQMVRSENWKHAQNQAEVAAKNMIGGDVAYTSVQSMWSDQFEIKLQTVGTLSQEGRILRGEIDSGKFTILCTNPAGEVTGALAINQSKDIRFAQMLIENRKVIDKALLADPKQDLRKLAA